MVRSSDTAGKKTKKVGPREPSQKKAPHKKASAEKGRRILVTSALPYVNNVPHLGNIIGCVLSADVFARFCRSRGYETLFVCGTDEHGTTTETKAIEEGVSPREICDKYYAIHKRIYEWFGCSFDAFGRTSKPVHHRITKDIFAALHDNGFIVRATVEQSFCEKCGRFLADRFVEGECPHCGAAGARGDQCDACGKLLTPTELKNPACKLCKSTPIVKKSTHLFLDLGKLQPELEKWVGEASSRGWWPDNARMVTDGWFREGLKPRAITRDLSWGVSVPLKGFEQKVFYVWFDAPIGYISITADARDDWERWWKDKDVELFQFMAKDNIPFHTILFPATLLGTRQTWTMLHHISSTEYLNYEAGKFSKSRNVGVFGNDVMSTGIPADVWRYYLLVNRPEKADTTFLWDDFGEKLNNELAANIGNFVNRVLSFLNRFAESRVPDATLSPDEEAFWNEAREKEQLITGMLEQVRLREALREVMALSKLGNAHFQKSEPWRLLAKEPARAHASLNVLAHLVKDLAILISPFLPVTSQRIFHQLNLSQRTWHDLGALSIEPGHVVGQAEPLFTPIEQGALQELRQRFCGGGAIAGQPAKEGAPSPIEKLLLLTARIEDVKDHPNADKLYVLTVDIGKEKRQLVAGLKSHYTKEQLKGRMLVIVANLKPATLRGVYSQGMLLAAESQGVVEALSPTCGPGVRVGLDGAVPLDIPGEISFEDFKALSLTVEGGVAHLEGKPLTVEGEPLTLEKVHKGVLH